MPAAKGDAMPALVRLFIDIALHRKGPQDVPASSAVFGVALLAYLAVGAAVLWPSTEGMNELFSQLGAELLLTVVVFGGLLAVTGRGARAGQTLAAMFGTGALLSALALPFVWVLARAISAGTPQPGMEIPVLFSTMALFMLLFASLLVTGHILRHALDWSYAAGVLAASAYFALSTVVFRTLFGVA